MGLIKGLMGLPALIVVAILVILGSVIGNTMIEKLLWWIAAAVMVIAAINTSSYK